MNLPHTGVGTGVIIGFWNNSATKSRKRKVLDKSFQTLTKRMEKRLGPLASVFTDKFTYEELSLSLNKCKMKKAPGPDKVSNDMIVQLSDYGKERLLDLLNKTWKYGNYQKHGKLPQ